MKKILFVTFLIFSNVIIAQNDYLIAENYYRQGAYEKATQFYLKLYGKNKYNTTYLRKLISCYQETGNFLQVDKLLRERIKQQPSQIYLNIFLGYNYERQQKNEKAKEFYSKTLQLLEKDANYGGVVGRAFREYNLLDYAIKAYEKAMLKQPKANFSFQIAQIYGEQGNVEKMFQSYINMIDKNANYLKNVKRYISRYITDDNEDQNNILLKKTLLKKSISNPKNAWNQLLSWLFIQQKDFGKAFIQEKALYAREDKFLSRMKKLGEISFENKDYEIAQKSFDFFISKTTYPQEKIDGIYHKIQIAILQKKLGVEEKIQAIFEEYGKNKTTLPIQIAYADYLTFQKNQPEKAKQVLEEAMLFTTSKFQEAQLKIKLGDILVFTEQFNKALLYFTQVQTKLKGHTLAQEARFKVAQTSYFKNDFKWAMAQLKVLKSSSSQLIANDATELFLIISDNQSKDSIPSGLKRYAKADLLAFQNKNEDAIIVLNDVIIAFKGQPIEDEALFKQAKLFIEEAKFDSAIANLENIIRLKVDGILVDDSLYELAELYRTKLNQPEKASEYYQKIIFDHQSSIYLVDARKKYRKLRGEEI
ncbi:tetratricopeptide repeat protein [Tenacibaculum maritimum]|uniref:tetratricopeptide repeat protein n=1 Tax=Tenacibaculum maritimum TaxID=107401 RepID=UPI001E3F11D4|nr:tetratricopeptide repeat protein [Tenacibaculum maritimum]MCD9562239.1 tetratricopeptide repeat protein [Tenacibaculum maritimum]MCD9564614.1 tetratricopeptide repeat protein [Tenacibaculum maritimum]MCD9578344.1 tetratricopeptide repeat protein [Tenacibaculum maritimum]MCD9595430.1 tetratricopeptide repeat protein [Tenacibaculum maritimum]MCD9612644.1 tetratricopeptide repeat protein [Tenacibaculum maritimum]